MTDDLDQLRAFVDRGRAAQTAVDAILRPIAFRVRWQAGGDHVHVRIFQAASPEAWQLNGSVTFDGPAWSAFRALLERGGVEVLAEDK